jgi:GTP-binding protein HflX
LFHIFLFHDQGQVENMEHGRGGVVIEGNLPGRLLARYQPYLMTEPEQPSEDNPLI